MNHDLTACGSASYDMTGPDGTKAGGWWKIEAVHPPLAMTFVDDFADADGNPVDSLPTTQSQLQLAEQDGKTIMTLRSRYASHDALATALSTGLEEGLTLAVGQMDGLLAGAGASTSSSD